MTLTEKTLTPQYAGTIDAAAESKITRLRNLLRRVRDAIRDEPRDNRGHAVDAILVEVDVELGDAA